MASVELASAYIALIPSAQGIAAKIQDEIGPPLTDAGKKAGEDTGKHFSEGFKRNVKLAAAAAGVAIIAVGKASVDAASNLDESLSKVDVVFADQSGAVKDWAKTSATAFGLSTQQALEAAGTYGNLFSAFGLGKKDTKDMSQSLVGLAADLASFNNTSVDDALVALQSGLSGETEPLKKFGIAISDARLKEEALSLGLIKSTKEALTPAAKAQASYSLIMKDSALAQGDFSRTSDGLANKQRIMAAKFGDLQASIGQALLPAMSTLVGFITDKLVPAIRSIGDWLSKHKPVLIAVGIVIGTALVGAFVAWATAAWAAFAANVALAAPIIAIGIAIAALVAGIIWAYQNWGFFRAAIDAVKEAILFVWHKILEPVIEWLSGHFVDLLKVVGEVLLAALTGGISEIFLRWDEITQFFKELPGKIIGFLSGLPSLLIDLGKKLIGGFFDGIIWVAENVLYQWFIGIPLKILELLKDANLWLLGKGKDLLLGLLHGIEDGVSTVFTWFFNLPVMIKDWLLDAGEWLFDAGKAVGKGFWEGIKAAWNSLADIATFKLPKVHIPGTDIDFGGNTISLLPHLARGAMDFGGGLAVVGERGPELVNLPRGSDVVPNGHFGGGGINLTINTVTGNPQEIWRVLEPVLRNYNVI